MKKGFLSNLALRLGATAGTVWGLPNYDGELFTASDLETKFLSMAGGLNGGLESNNFEFPTASLYTLPDAAQPAITETTSKTAPTADHIARTQEKNVAQIFQYAIDITYAKLSAAGRLSGINTAGNSNPVDDERAWQIAQKLIIAARDFNYTMHNGAYQIATSAAVANKSRGMKALITGGDNAIDASGAIFSKALMDDLLIEMSSNGAVFSNMVLFVNAFQKVMISDEYAIAPDSRSVGGYDIEQIVTDFGNFGIVYEKVIPAAEVRVYDMSVIAPVFQPVPDMGRLFYEELSKTGASEKGQLYGQMGLDHGPEYLHGIITNLKTTR